MHNINHQGLRHLILSQSKGSELLRGTGLEFPKSRLHRLGTVPAYLKREDELSFTMSGVKFRKLVGMHSYLSSKDSFTAAGSSRSQFLLALCQLCRQMGKDLELYLLQSHPWADQGTDRLYKTLFESFKVSFVSRDDWPKVNCDIKEGGVSEEALIGAMSLGLDLFEQIQDLDIETVWIDSGTGLSAQALIYSLGELWAKPPTVHVVLCAGREEEFRKGLDSYAWNRAPYELHRPPSARSYGSTNQLIWATIDRYWKEEGVLLDPIYTAKLMLTYEQHRPEKSVIIHSGGGLNNFGFTR